MAPHDALRRYPLLAALGAGRLGPWLASAQPITADIGETLFQAGTPGEHVYLVEEGRVRVLRPGKGGREISLGAYGPGDLIGEYALLPPGNNTATCRTSGAARLLRLPLGPLRDAVAAQPGLRDRLKAWLRLHAALGYLRGSSYLGFLSAPAVLQLADHFQVAAFATGHAIQAEGLGANRMYLIRKGEVVVEPTPGDPASTMILGAGDCFGAPALLGEAALPLAEVRTDMECLALGRAAFDDTAAGRGASVQTFRYEGPVERPHAWVAQEGATDCGLACLAMVARSHGLDVSLAQVRQRLQPGTRGSNLLELQRAAEGLGLRARAVRIGPDHLESLALPAVAHLTDGHYVVVYGVNTSEIVAGDPATGIVTLKAGAFRHGWSGHALLVVRPGDTAVLPAPVGPAPQAIMTPHSSFDTIQLHSFLDHFRAGDSEATDAFLRRICGRLERLARRMLRDFPNVRCWADTGDVLQSALMRLLHTLRAMQPESTRHFANLAAQHIRRELLDLARHYRNRLDRPGGDVATDGEGAAELPDPSSGLADDLDLWSAFHEQVERLPVEEREVVGLTYYHGWTQAQIAELFQVDERTVRRRWRAAALKLQHALGGRLPES
jgi:RNA polymerase sigma factor (sigma-70 family)